MKKIKLVSQAGLSEIQKMKASIDDFIDNKSRICLLTLSGERSLHLHLALNENGRIQYIDPNYLRIANTYAGHSVEKHKVLWYNPIGEEKKSSYYNIFRTEEGPYGEICIPIIKEDKLIGVLVIESQKMLDQGQVQKVINVKDDFIDDILKITSAAFHIES